uniref:CAP-Gly domain-containing protein n=1 Tax=Strigamia maritima TaxID=126957 RepID=T1IPT7_STRMM
MLDPDYVVITHSNVNLTVTSNINSFASERRFDKSLAVSAFKGKLELLTGALTGSMKLELYDKDNKLVTQIEGDDKLLGSFPIDDGMRIHVIDKAHQPGEFEDLSKVEKFELGDDEYSKRQDSARAFLAKNKLGKFSEKSADQEKLKESQLKQEKLLADQITVNSRCEVRVPGQMVRRGTVLFVGHVHFKPGSWVGIKYDEPFGKNDGSVDGQRYFDCLPKYGGFVKPQNITVGDFPEDDLGLDDEM